MTTIAYKDCIIAGNAKTTCPITAVNFPFLGDRIMAVGGAGNRMMVDQAIAILKAGNFVKKERAINELSVITGFSEIAAELLMVGDTHCYEVGLTETRVMIASFPKTSELAIGAGADVALNSFGSLNTTAVESVYCATLALAKSGDVGDIYYLDTVKNEGVVLEPLATGQRFWLHMRTKVFGFHKN